MDNLYVLLDTTDETTASIGMVTPEIKEAPTTAMLGYGKSLSDCKMCIRDRINIVMIGLAEELPEHEEKYELHRLLGALLSQNLSVNEKLNIIGNEYDIPMEEDFREDVSVMCNLSQKIKETGIETGIEIGKKEMIVKMHSKGYTTAQIADVAEMEEKKIEEIIKNEELLPA